MNNPNKIILHHSLTKDGKVVDFNAIKRYHMQTKKWSDIGYHYVIENVNGEYKILKGRDEKTPGAHCKEQHTNFESIGICLVGNFDAAEPPQAQLEKLYELLENIFARYGKLPIYGHNYFAKYKSCPGTKFPMDKILARVFQEKKKDWRIEAGEKALKELVEKRAINSPEYWKDKLTQPIEVWAVLNMINNISK